MSTEIMDFVGFYLAILTSLFYLPQILKTFKSKKADDSSNKGFWISCLLSAVLLETYAIFNGSLVLIIFQSLNLLFIIITEIVLKKHL